MNSDHEPQKSIKTFFHFYKKNFGNQKTFNSFYTLTTK